MLTLLDDDVVCFYTFLQLQVPLIVELYMKFIYFLGTMITLTFKFPYCFHLDFIISIYFKPNSGTMTNIGVSFIFVVLQLDFGQNLRKWQGICYSLEKVLILIWVSFVGYANFICLNNTTLRMHRILFICHINIF